MSEQRVAIVTGASRGIGEAVAASLTQKGYKTILISRNEDKLNEVADRILSTAGEGATKPEVVAYDLHPDYLSTRYAQQLIGVRKVAVQHHHAHIAACMAENGLKEPVIGLSFDGAGYGSDGKIWGGEILVADPTCFERAAYLSYVPMPGGATAIKKPWRIEPSSATEECSMAFKAASKLSNSSSKSPSNACGA